MPNKTDQATGQINNLRTRSTFFKFDICTSEFSNIHTPENLVVRTAIQTSGDDSGKII